MEKLSRFLRTKLKLGNEEKATNSEGDHFSISTKSRRSTNINSRRLSEPIVIALSTGQQEFLFPVHIPPVSSSSRLHPTPASSLVEGSSAYGSISPSQTDSCSNSIVEIEGEFSHEVLFDSPSFESSDDDDEDLDVEFDKMVLNWMSRRLELLRETAKSGPAAVSSSGPPNIQGRCCKVKIPGEMISNTFVLNYCSRQLVRVIPAGFPLLQSTLTILQLCCNNLTEVPEEICLLRKLEILVLSNNRLESIPLGIGYLVNLEQLYLDRNRLKTLPTSISGLRQLKTLSIAANEFAEIPKSVMTLNRLTTMECDRNPFLRVVPAEITQFRQLNRFHVEDCSMILREPEEFSTFERERSSKLEGPSLLECSARSLIRHRKPVLFSLPRHLKLYISRAEECSFCSGPMIDYRIVRCRMIRRMDRPIPIAHDLCCKHWDSEDERHAAIFSSYPSSTPTHLISTDRRDRSSALASFNTFDPEKIERGQRILSKFDSQDMNNLLVPLSLVVDWPPYPAGL